MQFIKFSSNLEFSQSYLVAQLRCTQVIKHVFWMQFSSMMAILMLLCLFLPKLPYTRDAARMFVFAKLRHRTTKYYSISRKCSDSFGVQPLIFNEEERERENSSAYFKWYGKCSKTSNVALVVGSLSNMHLEMEADIVLPLVVLATLNI